MTKPPLANIGALKLAKSNIRTYQENLEGDQVELYGELEEIMFLITDIIEESEEGRTQP